MTSTLTEGGISDCMRELGRTFAGPVLLPNNSRYDDVRTSWHLTIDPHPVGVAEATGPADVQSAVRAARQHDVSLAVQSTGHGTYVPADDGLLVKTTALSSVAIDPERQVARVGAGALWSDVIAAATSYGLAPLSAMPGVGVAGYTLGGGAGWLARSHGFAADSLLSAELVTADGALRTVGAEDYPDLFWALRGGGGNFGVVTALEVRLYPVVNVYTGTAMYPIERAPQVLTAYREWATGEQDELNTSVSLTQMPAMPQLPESVRGRRVLAVRVFSSASAEYTEHRLAPLREAAGEPLVNDTGPTTFAKAAETVSAPPPMAMQQRFELFDDLPDELVHRVTGAMNDDDTALTGVEIRHWGGTMARPEPGHGPVGHRDTPFSMTAMAVLSGPDDGLGATAVDELGKEVEPHATGGSFLNFLSDPNRTADAYTPDDYRRLREVKTAWDPDNVLGANHNIPPEGDQR